MFTFKNKSKEKQQKEDSVSSSSSVTITAGSTTSEVSSKSKKSKKQQQQQPEITKEDLKRLEQTKLKLFDSFSRKQRSGGDSGSESSQKMKPEVPPRPGRLKTSPLPPATHDEKENSTFESRPRNRSMEEPASPLFLDEDYGFHPLKTFNLPGLNLPVLSKTLISERTLKLQKLASGEFGFSLRRAQIIDRYADHSEERRTVIFAEPVSEERGPFRHSNSTGLLPGDQLLAVNGRPVESMTRDDIIQLIKDSGESLSLTVRPVPELSELTTRSEQYTPGREEVSGSGEQGQLQLIRTTASLVRSGSKRWKQTRAEKVGSYESVGRGQEKGKEGVWLSHRGGFASATLLGEGGSDGKVRIQLAGSDEMEVDLEDIQKANPPEMDRAEDLGQLLYLNESSALHLMRQRFGSNLIHTYAGSQSTVIINPVHPLSIYSEKVVQMFKGCKREDMPPHIYAVAQQVYRNMQATRRNQALVFTGRSGSGKTVQTRHFLHYLCLVAGSVGKLVTTEKLNSIGGLLEAFGNCRTSLNLNASRFATLITLDFDHVSQISAGLVQGLLLETQRVVRRPEGESNFHVFYYLWEGCDGDLEKELHLKSVEDPSATLVPLQKSVDRETARLGWNKLKASLDCLGVSGAEQRVIWDVLGGIIHLAYAGATKGVPSFKSQFLRASHAQKAAQLLGLASEDLHRTVFMSQHQEDLKKKQEKNNGSLRRGSEKTKMSFRASLEKMSITDRVGDGVEALEGFIIGLYRETFNLVVSLINRSLTSNYRTLTSISVVDCPGFQNTASVSSRATRKAGTFSDFCFNYVNERLHQLFYQTNFTAQMELYKQEQVDVDFEEPQLGPQSLVQIIDKQSQQELIKSTNIELRSQEKRGLLWLLDEESIFPGATDESFIERLFVHYGDRKDGLIRKSRQYNHFVLRHEIGTNSVTYNAGGWLRQAQENPVTRAVLPLLQDSQREGVSSLFLSLRSGGLPGVAASAMDSNASLRRTTTVYKTFNNPQAIKRKSYPAMVKLQMDCIVEMVRRVGRLHFVHCLLPRAEGGLGYAVSQSAEDPDNAVLNVPLLRSQIRGIQLLHGTRLNKIGFPERLGFAEFKRRFECLAPPDYKPPSALLDDRESAGHLFEAMEVDPNQYRLGLSQVFMRSDLLSQLEDKRDDKLSGLVVCVQAYCRSWVARRRLEKRKIQDLGIRCVQKNIQKYMAVRSWPWWKLYTRVVPLLNVNRTEEELKNQADEIVELRGKMERLEKSYAELRLHCDRLEARLADAQAEVNEERVAASQATDALESENTQRLRMEKEYGELKARHTVLERKAQRMELEAVEYRTLKSALPDEDDAEEGAYKQKYAELKQQLEAQKKQLLQEKLDEVDTHEEIKRHLDRKLAEMRKELEEETETGSSHKRRAQRATEELQDLKIHLEQVTARNTELEKKQRKFDMELRGVTEVQDSERAQKERLLREREEATAKVYRLEQELKNVKGEAEEQEMKCRRLEEDMQELSGGGGSGGGGGGAGAEVVHLKRARQELEKKCVDQEEELDEMAGSVQQLQATVTRLEMQMERNRQEHNKDLDAKELELEEIRAQTQRRVRSLEQQLDDEQEEKAAVERTRRDLEARLRDAGNLQITKDESGEVHLKRDLRRTKALLKDAQTMLQHYKDNAPSRGMIKQLKNQLEDAEFGRLSAVKGKQGLEADLQELRGQLDIAWAGKAAAEERCIQLLKEKNGIQAQLDDQDEELQQLLKKYKAQVQQGSVDHITLNDQTEQIGDLEKTCESLREQLGDMANRNQWMESHMVDKHKLKLAEDKIRDLEAKLSLELSIKTRLEANFAKTKESTEGLQGEIAGLKAARDREQELNRRIQAQGAHSHDVLADAQKREAEAAQKNHDLEAALERAEQENQLTVADLKLALRRIDDLQAALHEDLDIDLLGDSDSEEEPESLSNGINGFYAESVGTRTPKDSSSRFTSPLPRSLTSTNSSGERPRAASGSSESSGKYRMKTSTPMSNR